MTFDNFKFLYMFSCLGLGLIILSPTLAIVIRLPGGERFSELWILGPDHLIKDYPFNVSANEAYKFYLGISNHINALEYYRVYVKFRNQTEPLPDALNGTPSALDPLFEYSVFLSDNESWEKEILFSFADVSFQGNACKISKIVIDGYVLNIDKIAMWNAEKHGFYCQIFFELWFYDDTSLNFRYHNRFVWIWLNMTVSI